MSAKKVILVIMFPITLIIFSVCSGFFLDDLLESVIEKTVLDDLRITGLFTIVSGLVYIILMHGLLGYYDRIDEKKKTLKWRLDKYLIPMYVVGFISALVLITTRFDDPEKIYLSVGFKIFPMMGIIATPNIVRHVIREKKGWKKNFYESDNLHKTKDSKEFYKVKQPLSFERAINIEVLKNNLVMLASVLVVLSLIVLYLMHTLKGLTPNDIYNSGYNKKMMAKGLEFLFLVFLFTVAIPIIAYCITSLEYELKMIHDHEYIAYHAVVQKADGSTITIDKDGKLFHYENCSYVNIDPKTINNTKGTLVFVPDDVMFIPDEL
ncbi:MAG: hypothetical protein IKO10_15255 [Lachnospiraceae bacterium]|nr:hypothetical protein [Lachnospiraceae bacterium]